MTRPCHMSLISYTSGSKHPLTRTSETTILFVTQHKNVHLYFEKWGIVYFEGFYFCTHFRPVGTPSTSPRPLRNFRNSEGNFELLSAERRIMNQVREDIRYWKFSSEQLKFVDVVFIVYFDASLLSYFINLFVCWRIYRSEKFVLVKQL